MKTKVELIGVVVIQVDGRIYMCGATTDGRFAHNYIPEGKTREVMCVYTTAEACHAHDKLPGTHGDKPMSKEVQEFIDWAANNGFRLSDLEDSLR